MTPQRAVEISNERGRRDERQFCLLEMARRQAHLTGRDGILTPRERTIGFVRASIALVRTIGLQHDQICHVGRHVLSKPPGEIIQEIGGTAVTLMALCESLEISLCNAEVFKADLIIAPGGAGSHASAAGASERSVRDDRQLHVLEWARRVFGVPGRADTASPQERSLRFIEEAIELAQAVGLDAQTIEEISWHSCLGQVGAPFQEAGRSAVALMGVCESLEISLWEAEVAEFDRVLSKTPEHFQARQAEKRAAGLEYAP